MAATMKPCKTCAHDVAARANVCPSCGQTRPAGGAPRGLMWATFILGLLLVAWAVAGSIFAANSFAR